AARVHGSEEAVALLLDLPARGVEEDEPERERDRQLEDDARDLRAAERDHEAVPVAPPGEARDEPAPWPEASERLEVGDREAAARDAEEDHGEERAARRLDALLGHEGREARERRRDERRRDEARVRLEDPREVAGLLGGAADQDLGDRREPGVEGEEVRGDEGPEAE